MHDIVIRRGDTLPLIRKTLYLGGNPVDLSGYTVTFQVGKLDGSTFFFDDHVADVVPDATGVVQYQWTDADTTAVTDDAAFAFFRAEKDTDVFTIPNHRPLSLLLTSSTHHEYSYSGDPSARPIDRIRFLLQDTDMDRALFTDSEIEFVLSDYTNPYLAAEELALVQSSKFTNLKDKTVGPLSISYGTTASRWTELAANLRVRGRRSSGGGAVAITTQKSREPYFRLGMHDIPAAAANTSVWDPDNLLGEETLP
jgi:hypothetical protein